MNRILAISKRILSQFVHDKRTLALLFVAPIIVLWLLSVLLGTSSYVPTVATVDLPKEFQVVLERQDVEIKDVSGDEAENLLRENKADAVLSLEEESATLNVWAEGSDSAKTAAVLRVVGDAMTEFSEDARADMEQDMSEMKNAMPAAEAAMDFDIDEYMSVQEMKTTYLHGSSDWEMFDFYGPIFIGIFIFAFTFITSGMSLVNEKSAGTMSRFLATPVRSWQILGGYSLGFGLLSMVQVSVIVVVALEFIGFPNEGSVGLMVCIAVSLAIASVTLGLLVSGLASNAFQVIQLMLLFILPQILLSGLFDLSNAPGWLQVLSRCLPLTYGVDAMREVMLRGSGFDVIAADLAIVWGFIVVFFVLAALGFRKKHAKRGAEV